MVADPGDFRGPDIRDGIKRRFVRWNDAADGSGNQYEAGTWHTPLTNHDLTLYAQWWEDGDSVLRQTGVAGGLVFYDKGAYSDGWRYLELSPLSTEWSSIVFGGHAVEIAGTSEEIGTGLANTQIIVAALVGVGETGKAAQLCNDLVYNGYSDWFLPTVLELQAIAPPLGTGPASLSRLTRTSYWASHTHGVPPLTFASVFSFNQAAYGHLHSGRETNTARVRAVRRF
ncbi:MAG: DUF1566 domain-containing protein [Spirochaetaceae bacterium]|nr:MAG: DUF1566 domain-containing protein [Spirochaetaceae bacterium]